MVGLAFGASYGETGLDAVRVIFGRARSGRIGQ
jgi:hypothetical protein